MILDIDNNTNTTKEKAIEYFKGYWGSELVNDIMDIQLLSPVRERGDSSVLKLNLEVQNFINPYSDSKQQIKMKIDKDHYYYLREGDKVMNMKNNYKTTNTEYQNTNIYNGWIGTLESIDTWGEMATVYFPIINDRVLIPINEVIKSVELGYACTVHKCQGSSAKVIIGVLDYSTPPKMRTKELLYTLLTRAEKLCVLVGQNLAIDEAIKTSGVRNKNTFLIELLK
jgi:exodeoxyribonuclease V alpha subunit